MAVGEGVIAPDNVYLPLFRVFLDEGGILELLDDPIVEITYLPSLIDMPDIKPGYVRGSQPLGSSLMEW